VGAVLSAVLDAGALSALSAGSSVVGVVAGSVPDGDESAVGPDAASPFDDGATSVLDVGAGGVVATGSDVPVEPAAGADAVSPLDGGATSVLAAGAGSAVAAGSDVDAAAGLAAAVESDVAVVEPLAPGTVGAGSVTSDADATPAGTAVIAAAHTSVTIAVRSARGIACLAERARCAAASGLNSLDQRDTSWPDVSNTGRPPGAFDVWQSSQHPALRN
jgi:hypothetical protein